MSKTLVHDVVKRRTDKAREYTRLFKARVIATDNYVPPRTDLSMIRFMIDLVSGKFLTTGNNSKNLREQVLAEQQNVSLIAALFLTIAAPALLSLDTSVWPDDSAIEFNLYQLFMNISNSCLIGAVFISVFYLLCIQECSSDEELKRLLNKLGGAMEFPILLLLIGAVSLGPFGISIYCYNRLKFSWFLPTNLLCNVGAFLVYVPKLVNSIRAVYEAKNGQCGTAIIERAELRKAMNVYLESLSDPQAAVLSDFKGFLLEEMKCLEFFPMTERKIPIVFEQELKKRLPDCEYEPPQDEQEA